MLDIAFVSLLDFLVRTQGVPEPLPKAPQNAAASAEPMARAAKMEVADNLVIDLSRSPSPASD